MTKAKAKVDQQHDAASLVGEQASVLLHMALKLIATEAFSRVVALDAQDPAKFVATLIDGSVVEVEADVTDPASLDILATAVMTAPLADVAESLSPDVRFDRLLRAAVALNGHLRDSTESPE